MEFNQKYLYLDNCAELYYQSEIYEKIDDSTIKFVKNFINSHSINHLISLGCGNSLEEKNILFKLKRSIKYTGLDFSQKMLDMSKETLDRAKIKNYSLIKGDFLTTKIESSISNKLYYFSGYTMCNLNSEEWKQITDLLDSGDYLIFYVVSIPNPFIIKDIIMESVENICNNKIKRQQYMQALKIIGINDSDGDFSQEYLSDDLSMIVRYSFNTLQGKTIKVQDVRIYSISKVIEFFQENNCRFIQKKINIDTCIYAFQKI